MVPRYGNDDYQSPNIDGKLALAYNFFLTQTGSHNTFAGIFGPRDNDFGIRLSNSTTWENYRNGAAENGFGYGTNFFINAVNTRTFKPEEPYIFMVRANQPNWSQTWSLGNFFHWPGGVQTRAYNGMIGEVIAYDRVLTAAEQKQVEEYLAKKWLHGSPLDVGLLPSTLQLVLQESATLDLGQNEQTLESLTGRGAVVNGKLTLSKTLYVAVDQAGNVDALSMDHVELADNLQIVFSNTPANGSLVLQSNALTVNSGTLQLPSGWMAKARDNNLYVARLGSILIVR